MELKFSSGTPVNPLYVYLQLYCKQHKYLLNQKYGLVFSNTNLKFVLKK